MKTLKFFFVNNSLNISALIVTWLFIIILAILCSYLFGKRYHWFKTSNVFMFVYILGNIGNVIMFIYDSLIR